MSTPADFAQAAQDLAAQVLAAAANPADAVRLLQELASFLPDDPETSDAIGAAMATMQRATGDLFRRAAVVALARASTTYQPASYDDAVALRNAVTAALDAEILTAADQGEDATYSALKALRQAVVQDITNRGADLAPIQEFKTNAPGNALALANKLYQDSTRADELTIQAGPRHPAFFGTDFKALSK